MIRTLLLWWLRRNLPESWLDIEAQVRGVLEAIEEGAREWDELLAARPPE